MSFETFFIACKAMIGARCSDADLAAIEAGKGIKWQDIKDDLQ